MKDSAYQRAIYSVFRNTDKNINISAVAGSGKTTVLLRLLEYVPNDSKCLFLAFNNSVVDELRKRNPRSDDSNISIMTVHSCGWRAILRRYGGKCRVNKNKALAKVEYLAKRQNIDNKRKRYLFYVVPKIVDLMRCNLCEPTVEDVTDMIMRYDVNVDETDIRFAIEVFGLMNVDRRQFDFMDMIYVPVTDSSVRVQKYDCVMCDESQDFSLAQQQFIRRCISRSGRLVTVGDRRQAIYGFAGADYNSYDNLCAINGKSVRMPLSVSYRCAKNIVTEAQQIVPEIKSNPLSPDGIVAHGSMTDIRRGDWVLCRNLKPLVTAYMWLTRNRIRCKIRGVDIADGIVGLVNKINARNVDELVEGMNAEKQMLFDKLQKRGVLSPAHHPKMELMMQKIDVVKYLCCDEDGVCLSVDQLRSLIEEMFTDSTDMTKIDVLLTTVHKSKGLENERVFFLMPELIPSKYATMEWQLEQERNLKYVGITRAKQELIYVSGDTFMNDMKRRLRIFN